MKIESEEDLRAVREEGLKSLYPDKTKVSVGMATCGLATGAGKVWETLNQEVQTGGHDIILAQVGCIGFCQEEPIVDVLSPGKSRIIYKEMTSEKVSELLTALKSDDTKDEWALCKTEEEDFLVDNTVRKLSTDGRSNGICLTQDLDFYKKQYKIALRNCGFIDPENITEYIARGG